MVIDTLRTDRLGAYGAAVDHMPALSAWASGAAVFRQATSVAPFTMPSVAALMTGMYPDRAGIVVHASGVSLDRHAGPTLAELARQAGLRTGAVVANPWLARKSTGFDRGFDVYSAKERHPLPLKNPDAEGVTDSAIEILDSFDGSPFFLWVHYFDPHMPYQPPLEHARSAGAPDRASRVAKDFSAEVRNLTRIYSGSGYERSDVEQAVRLYDGEVRYVDAQLDRLLSHLERSGLAAGTVVVIASDHGEALGEHGLFFAHDFTLYEELIGAVLMMRGPGIEAGTRENPVSLIDVLPALCRRLGRCPQATDGIDLLGPPAGERTLFAAATPFRERAAHFPRLQVPGLEGRWTMARRGNRKLIRIPRADGGADLELFDLAADPRELTNLHGKSTTSHETELSQALDRWHADMHAARPASSARGQGISDQEGSEDERMLRSLGYLQ